MALKTLATVTVTGANTATVLSATRQVAHTVYIYAFGQALWIGDSNVSSTGSSERGVSIPSGSMLVLTSEIAANDMDLSKMYIASTSAAAKAGIAFIEG